MSTRTRFQIICNGLMLFGASYVRSMFPKWCNNRIIGFPFSDPCLVPERRNRVLWKPYIQLRVVPPPSVVFKRVFGDSIPSHMKSHSGPIFLTRGIWKITDLQEQNSAYRPISLEKNNPPSPTCLVGTHQIYTSE